ncbi:MAG: HEAT repeat domain-containing protein [Candidatus Omnitrophica bacterium]|nr:HEAT repeat domain-containing protein [Candidatus Omnitrophota bacterium]
MENEKILEDFFRSLKVALTNAFSYSKDHPYFIKSVENFKVKLEDALAVLNPLRIGVTSTGILVDGKNLAKSGFYDELARLLHQRKIKSFEIRNGVSLQELVQFLSVISLSQKDIFKGGGINAILKDKQLAHFTIGELDYSAFLQEQGQECADIWGYILKEATHSNDPAKLEVLADDFGPLIKRSSEKDILETEEVPSDIHEFLVCLRGKNKEKFDKCSKDLFLWLLRNKKSLNEEKLAKLVPVFDSLSAEDFSALLWEGISQEDNFDDLSLQLFSKIAEQKNPPKIAEGFLARVKQSQYLKDNPNALKRIQNLLTAGHDDRVSAVYRNTLESLIKGIAPSGGLFFDQRRLRGNYHYIILNMLSTAGDEDNLELAGEILEKEFAGILEDNDLDFLKSIFSLLMERKKQGIGVCANLEKKLSAFIENIALNQSLLPQQEFLLDMVSSPSQDVGYYLDKIFASLKPGNQVVSLFFRLFAQQMDAFYQRLGQKLQDMEFLAGLIDALGRLADPRALEALEYIYSSANELIKIEVLTAMAKFKKVDVDFLMRQLSADSFLLRKNLFSVLILDAQAREKGLDVLFNIPNFFGKKNDLLMENMQLVFDLRFVEAAGRIRDLARLRFFWNKKMRNKAKQILKEWDVF